ncbi:MAG: spermidine synthase [Puniceicoccaceae bacterium]
MAILWENSFANADYSVRSAGSSIRLYRNGVHHSQWNPRRPLNGSVWDLLSIPAALRPDLSAGRVLILGFGAGAVARQLDCCFQATSITGVEIDPVHLSIARGFFECGDSYQYIQGDAVQWIDSADEQWDYIIDDLYGDSETALGEPFRTAPLDETWFLKLSDRLSRNGILVLNDLDPQSVQNLPPFNSSKLRGSFQTALQLSIEGYDNRAVAFCRCPYAEEVFYSRLRQILRPFSRSSQVLARYQIQELRIGSFA